MKKIYLLLAAMVATMAAGSIAWATDLPVKAPAAPALVHAPYTWAGLYIGGNLGGGWADHTTDATLAGATLYTFNTKPSGVVGGGQIGYNWQWNKLVLGLEADIQGSNQKGTANTNFTLATIPFTTSVTERLDWFGTLRGRIGYAWDRNLIYFTGGWAYGHHNATTTTAVPAAGISATTSGSRDLTNGWTVGGGWEWAFADRWSAKVEYLYIDFGSDSGNTPTVGTLTVNTNHLTDNVVRAGLNYKFW